MSTRSKGNYAEQLACEYLRQCGWQILNRNYHAGGGEIDIVAKDIDEIVFIEVKSLRDYDKSEIFGTVTKSKLHKVHKAVQSWLLHCPKSAWRVDFVGMILNSQNRVLAVEHVAYL